MSFAANLESVQQRIATACDVAGRDPATVELLAVTKGHSVEAVREAVEHGLTLFGESKVQEAKVKIPQCPPQTRWHMIGHLQSNKVRDAVHFFSLIHSVDSLALAEEINHRAEQAARYVSILLEINVAGEATKYGFTPAAVLEQMEQLNALSRLEIHGLMTIAPWSPDPERARPVFRQLREVKERCEQALGAPLAHLSMGMSGDFDVAVEEGATLVRLGTVLFGARNYSK